ncbi:MAG: sulfur carrier protein [Planctomycetota bacterium]|jgi:sulfur carrier protein
MTFWPALPRGGAPVLNETTHISIHVNGEATEVAGGSTVADLVAGRGLKPVQVAVELNRSIVPRVKHAEAVLSAGDRVEIVTMVGGG